MAGVIAENRSHLFGADILLLIVFCKDGVAGDECRVGVFIAAGAFAVPTSLAFFLEITLEDPALSLLRHRWHIKLVSQRDAR
jgi:hypothetical protein